MRSGSIKFGTDLTFLMNFTTLLYKPDIEVFGAQFAAGVFVPLVDLDLDASLSIGGMAQSVSDSTTGLGDVALIPFALYWNNGNIHKSFAQFVVTPTGDYSVDNLINDGLNYWSFDTNFALTYLNPETGRCSATSKPKRRVLGRRYSGIKKSAIRMYRSSPSGCMNFTPRTGWKATTCSLVSPWTGSDRLSKFLNSLD